MSLGEPVRVRLSLEKQMLYEAQAAAEGKPLGTYLRERLEREDVLLEEMGALRRAVERATGAIKDRPQLQNRDASQGLPMGLLVELLLLTRANIAPAKSQMVQKEVERIGLDIWSGEKE